MARTLRLGRLRGVEIHLDWSWLLILGLLVWNLTVVFRSWHPTWVLGPALLLATTTTGLAVLCILVHALAPIVVARGLGLQVHHLRLFLFGGVSDVERHPGSPRAELWMALAGPLASLALGGILTYVSRRALGTMLEPHEAMARLVPFETVLYWLGPINLALGLFNLLPGFPLDGGRILRAVIWSRTGSLQRATFIAAKSGSLIGIALIVAGIAMAIGLSIPLLGRGTLGLWVALFGWYLRLAAEGSAGGAVAPRLGPA